MVWSINVIKINNFIFKFINETAKKSGKILGIDKVEFMDFPDNEMDTISTLVVAKNIENSIKEFKVNPSFFISIIIYLIASILSFI